MTKIYIESLKFISFYILKFNRKSNDNFCVRFVTKNKLIAGN